MDETKELKVHSEGEIDEFVHESLREFAKMIKNELNDKYGKREKLTVKDAENIVDSKLEEANDIFYTFDVE